MNPQLAAKLAGVYVNGEHQPEHPSYRAFVAETIEQFKRMRIHHGYAPCPVFNPHMIVIPVRDNPFSSSEEMFKDIEEYHRLKVWTGGTPLAARHPLAERVNIGGGYWNMNVVFRAVHDYYGHYLTRSPFETIDGELAAYKAHSLRYSPEAQLALFSETILQLAYYTHCGEFVPVQKCVINPFVLATFQIFQRWQ